MNVNEIEKKAWALAEKILPYTFYRYLVFLQRKIKCKGRELSYRQEFFLKYKPFSKKKYYIARFEYGTYGLFAVAQEYIFVAERARHRGMQPVILWQWNCDFESRNFLGDNVWELVFRQCKIHDILDRNATILVGDANAYEMLHMPEKSIMINDDPTDARIHASEENWREYYKKAHKYVKKYWKFNRTILEETNRKYKELFRRDENVLGIALRENFSEEYTAALTNVKVKRVYRSHPLGPNVSEILDIVEECLAKWGCSKIFVASIYSDSIVEFEKRFPEKIIYCERERVTLMESVEKVNSQKSFLGKVTGEDEEVKVKSYCFTKEYAQETILLSKCTYLVGAPSGQTIAALALNGGKYKDIKVLEDKNHIKEY